MLLSNPWIFRLPLPFPGSVLSLSTRYTVNTATLQMKPSIGRVCLYMPGFTGVGRTETDQERAVIPVSLSRFAYLGHVSRVYDDAAIGGRGVLFTPRSS